MNLLEYTLAVISILSFLLAIWSTVRAELIKKQEVASRDILTERLNSLYQGSMSLFHTADAIIQIPKKQENPNVTELQNMARVLRAQILAHAEIIKDSQANLNNWRYGKVFFSTFQEPASNSEGKDNQNSSD